MIKALRKKKFVKITLWVVIVAFGLGAGSAATMARNYAGKIFNKKISIQEYQASYSAVFNRARMIYGDQLSKMQKFLNLESQAWDRLILLYYAKKKKIKTTNKEVISKIASMPIFHKEGIFDERTYNHIIKYILGVTPRDFEESVRGDLIISKIVSIEQKDATVSEEQVKGTYKAKNEKADISYIIVESVPFKKDVVIDDAELEPFYNQNKDRFLTPQKRSVYYVQIPFPKEEPKEEKQDNADTQESNEKKDARRLATTINNALASEENFAVAAKEYDLEMKETAAFAFGVSIPGIGLSYPFSITAFGLTAEESTNTVEEQDAFYVIKLKEKLDPYIPEFIAIKDNIREELVGQKIKALAASSARNYSNILKSGEDTMENLSKSAALEIKTIKDMSRGSYVDDVGVNAEFNKACFIIKEGEFTGPIDIETGSVVIRLDKLKPIDEEKFNLEKDEFKQELLRQAQQEVFQGWFIRLKEKANLKVSF